MSVSTGPARAGLRVRLLGRVQIALGETPIPDEAWRRRNARTLLLLLLAARGHRLPRETVIEQLWPESSPDSAAKSVYVTVHALRRVLEPDLGSGRASSYVDVTGDLIRLLPGAVEWVDVDAFEAEIEATGEDRRRHLSAALALYSGDFLADEPYLDWPVIRREYLRSRWREAVLEYAELEQAAGRSLLAVPAIERVLQADVCDETAYRALMRALAAAGRREDALRQYERCAAALRDELGIEPGEETEALATEIRAVELERPTHAAAQPVDRIELLPAPPNLLIGRAREVEEVLDLLVDPDVRLVTITGPGGVGKTRLALEAASLAADEFGHGVCFVSLAPIRDPALVLPAVLREIGLEESAGGAGQTPLATLQHALHDRRVLLLLDNLEQVLDAAPELAALLAGCPRVTLLVTSREPLHLRAEHDFPLGPLPSPDPARMITAGSAARYPAVELFVERARAAQRGFALTEENAAAITLLCARLDGLPLAIELAAARVRHQRPAQLVAGLADRFALLAGGFRDLPPRQRTMRAAIAWSYDLLTPDEQTLFRRLAIFVGGFTADAAVHLAAGALDPTAIPNLLDALVDKALLWRDDGEAEGRFGMLETIREYGLALLADQRELAAAGEAHATWCIAFVEASTPELTGPDQAEWSDRLQREHANIRAALGRLLQAGNGPLALRMAGPLWRFWWNNGYGREGLAWIEQALALADDAEPAIRARAYFAAGELAEGLAEYEKAVACLETALAIRQELNDTPGAIEALNALGVSVRITGDLARAETLHRQALALLQTTPGSLREQASTLNNLGAVAYFRGDRASTREYWEQTLAIVRELEDQRAMCVMLGNLGALAVLDQDPVRAIAFHEEAVSIARRLDNVANITRGLLNLAGAKLAHGDDAEARELFEDVLERCRQIGDRYGEAIALHDLGKIAQRAHAPDLAETRFAESLGLYWTARNLTGVASGLEQIAMLAGERRDDHLAARLFGAAQVIRDATGAAREPADCDEYEQALIALRGRLGDAAFASAWAAGERLSTSDAVDAALGRHAPAMADRSS